MKATASDDKPALSKREEQMKLRAESMHKEKIKHMNDRLEEMGIKDFNDDIPPDFVDEKAVERSLYTALRAMIPYTNEWYEAKAAEEEMDDLTKIRIEKTKANDLLALSKLPSRQEEALQKLMSETNNDFHYFNRLRSMKIAEGTYQPPKAAVNAFKDAGGGKNRVKKAIKKPFEDLDADVMRHLNAMNKLDKKKVVIEKVAADAPCTWRGKSKTGEWLQCTNLRMRHPVLKNDSGEPVILKQCAYHVPTCIGDHEYEEPPPINSPNLYGYCNSCTLTAKGVDKSLLVPCTVISAPGVAPVNVEVMLAKVAAAEQALEERQKMDSLQEGMICQWRPSPSESLTEMKGYICQNVIFKNPETNALIPYCAYHAKRCVKKHDESSGEIEIANIHALCTMHHMSEHKKPPEKIPFPFPGMLNKLSMNAWKLKTGHWAAPNWKPKSHILLHEFEAPEPDCFFDSLKKVLFYMRKRMFGRRCATKIQSHWRRYCLYRLHVKLKIDRKFPLRHAKAILIQAQMRRFLGVRRAKERLEIQLYLIAWVSAHVRGRNQRRFNRRHRASKKISHFFKSIKSSKFRDTVFMLMYLRRALKVKIASSIAIERVVRGFIGRRKVRQIRLFNIMISLWARRLTRWFQRAVKKLVKLKISRMRLPVDKNAIARALCSRRLAIMITEMFRDRQRRKELHKLLENSLPVVTKLIRGYLVRKGAKKLAFLRNAMRNWCPVVFASEFLRSHLESSIIMFPPKPPPPVVKKALPALTDYVRYFVPDEYKKSRVIPRDIFEAAVLKWYEKKGFVLLQSELDSIESMFKDPQDIRKINLTGMDDLVHLHPFPCRKHGRAICAACTFYLDCLQPKCKCKCFRRRGTGSDSASCKNCPHPSTMHRLVPLQIKEKFKPATMLSIMHAVRDPDLSMPGTVSGLPLSTALGIKKKKSKYPNVDGTFDEEDTNYDEFSIGSSKASEYMDLSPGKQSNWQIWGTCENLLKSETEDQNIIKRITSSVPWKTPTAGTMPTRDEVAALALRLQGDQVADVDEYWDYTDESTIKASKTSDIPLPIEFNSNSPDANSITAKQFWHSASKNPNKTSRDYVEGFEHNIPLPVVLDKDIVYTFEGSKLYFTLLLQIIEMEKTIDRDSSAFLRLIIDHIQIFERHWRKFVSDIRVGKLNRNLKIDPEKRKLYENTSIPKPSLAKTLDSTFRELGFHNKALGKDIETFQYAELKHRKSPNPRARRPSLPKQSIIDDVVLNNITPGGKCKECAGIGIVFERSKKVKCPKCGGKGHIDPKPILSKILVGRPIPSTTISRGSVTATPDRAQALSRERSPSKQEKRQMTGEALNNGALQELQKIEAELAIRSPSRRSSRGEKRRGSETDILIPLPSVEQQKINRTELSVLPRSHYYEIVQDRGRYLCPFPACGKNFKSKDAAFLHIPVHENRMRLSVPSPLPDSHLNVYWPQGVPWLKEGRFREHVLPPGSFECPVVGCGLVVPNRGRLESHLKMVHKKVPNTDYYSFLGDHVTVPPLALPDGVTVLLCDKHVQPIGRCPQCMEVEGAGGPSPPLKFYDKVSFDFTQKNLDDAMAASRTGKLVGETEGKHLVEIFSCSENTAIRVKGGVTKTVRNMQISVSGSLTWVGRVVGMCIDRNEKAWVCVNRFYSVRELDARGIQVQAADRNYQLFKFPTADGSHAVPVWTHVSNIVSKASIATSTKEEFYEGKKSLVGPPLPPRDTFFVLPESPPPSPAHSIAKEEVDAFPLLSDSIFSEADDED